MVQRYIPVLALLFGCVLYISFTGAAAAQVRTLKTGETYAPGIWVDPDGCEHWVMDDGQRGFMSARRTRDGKPVCRKINHCGVVITDTLFPSGSAKLSQQGASELSAFFRKAGAVSYIVTGHTDSVGSPKANLALSAQRAKAVARVAQSVGGKITDVRGLGERQPKASNATESGRAQNRRVEIMCVR